MGTSTNVSNRAMNNTVTVGLNTGSANPNGHQTVGRSGNTGNTIAKVIRHFTSAPPGIRPTRLDANNNANITGIVTIWKAPERSRTKGANNDAVDRMMKGAAYKPTAHSDSMYIANEAHPTRYRIARDDP